MRNICIVYQTASQDREESEINLCACLIELCLSDFVYA